MVQWRGSHGERTFQLLQVDAMETSSYYQLEVALPGVRKGATGAPHMPMEPHAVLRMCIASRVRPCVLRPSQCRKSFHQCCGGMFNPSYAGHLRILFALPNAPFAAW